MRTRVACLGLVALLTLAGCGGSPSASPPSSGTPTASVPTTSDSGTPTVGPAGTTETPTTAPVEMGSTVTIGSVMSVGVPKGWVALPSEIVQGGSGSVCLSPRRGGRNFFGCGEIEIDFGRRLPGEENSRYAPDQVNGWYHATDASQCPFVPQDGKFVPLKMANGFDKGLKPVGAHQAAWNRWTASCAGHTFHPQAWYLPKSKVVIFDYFGHAETASVLASAEFAADGIALATYLSGHLIAVAGSKITVQPFHTYTNGAAGKAWATAHGVEYPFPNDYYDADEGAKRTVVIDASTSCTGNVAMGKGPGGGAMSCPAFLTQAAKHKGMPMGFWVLPSGSSAQAAIEIFRP